MSDGEVRGSRPGQETVIGADRVVERLETRGVKSRWTDPPPYGFRSISTDSRDMRPGGLFCAVVGERADGHDFLADAAERGAAAAVVERPDPDLALPQLAVADSRTAIAHLAALFFGDPAGRMQVVGITGTNGKTTTAWLLREILRTRSPTALIGTLGVMYPDGRQEENPLTTPGPVALMNTLARFVEEDVRHVTLELSSHALHQRRADGISLSAGVFTNLTREHLDYHPDMAAYREAKLRACRLVRSDGVLVVNADDPAWSQLRDDHADVLTYGLEAGDADIRAVDPRHERGRSRWRLVSPWGEEEVELPLQGEYNIYNALAAAAVGLHEGMEPADVADRLRDVAPVPGRMEILRRDPSLVVRDYAHTPDGLHRALTALRRTTPGRLILVFGCGGERDPGKRPVMGQVAEADADIVLITTDNPRSEDPERIADAVLEGFGGDGFERIPDRQEAIARALELAGAEDVVLLAGKGHETYQQIGDRKLPFDEARIVAELTRAGRS